MQQYNPSHIELIWADGLTNKLFILEDINKCHPNQATAIARYIQMGARKPTHFIWHDPNARPVTPKMRAWVNETFPKIFDTSNKMLLFASIGTAPKEIREQLKDIFNEQTNLH